jgi:two-component system KDP operon response regulator KdpE
VRAREAGKDGPTVLIVEDDAETRAALVRELATRGYRTTEAEDGRSALARWESHRPDLVLLDLGLPDIDGQELLVKLRDWLKAPIIVLSARSQDAQKIQALTHGADDYLTKPFSSGELLARIHVALRHAAGASSGAESPTFEVLDLKADLAARRVFVRGEEVHLTRIEYKLLTTLIRYAGRVLTHPFMLEEVWGKDHIEKTQHLRVAMAGLRRKIEADPAQPRHILTEQGVGYRLACE